MLSWTFCSKLEGGWSPIDEKANDRLKRQVSSLTLGAAKKLFGEYHIAKGTRKKSRQSYLSKLNQFINYYEEDKKVSEISYHEITEFLNFMEKDAANKYVMIVTEINLFILFFISIISVYVPIILQ
ncbi:phage integrase N-terminal SAM-like domain-containing protein [Pedobacter sp. R-06]|uniref:phage integrase N-terminal SAM-like domain-containing protein n=1 Tax=Pedobacter sp. R-06 TaxID=3404051 RepID=UPI003CE80344